ncbi:MAG TPA: hypothetical protein VFL91_32440 [Thermomicrobiales bacterium]|nr:hypothetical protein [Thermomicrobiales bacterium]
MALEQANQRAEQVSGVSNVAYDLLTLLQNKLQGVTALESYRRDAERAGDAEAGALLADLERRELEDVARLRPLASARLG